MKTSKDGRVVFDDKWHSFLLDGKKRLRSWSKIIKQYTEQVDSRVLAERVVAKKGGNVEVLLKEWEIKATVSRELGIAVHAVFEKYANIKHPPAVTQGREIIAASFIKDFFESK